MMKGSRNLTGMQLGLNDGSQDYILHVLTLYHCCYELFQIFGNHVLLMMGCLNVKDIKTCYVGIAVFDVGTLA